MITKIDDTSNFNYDIYISLDRSIFVFVSSFILNSGFDSAWNPFHNSIIAHVERNLFKSSR